MSAQETPQAPQDAFMSALKAGDGDKLASYYAQDTRLYPVDGMQAQGRGAIRKAWAPFLQNNKITRAELIVQGSESHGDTVVAWGLWHLSVTPKNGGGTIELDGRFMDMARKIDGRWRYEVDHAFMPLPPAK